MVHVLQPLFDACVAAASCPSIHLWSAVEAVAQTVFMAAVHAWMRPNPHFCRHLSHNLVKCFTLACEGDEALSHENSGSTSASVGSRYREHSQSSRLFRDANV